MIVEFIERDFKYRFNMVNLNDLDQFKARPHSAFRTIFPYDQSILAHMESKKTKGNPKGTNEGFEGLLFCDKLIIDLDGGTIADDIEMAKRDVRTLANRLYTKYRVPVDDISIYFSGQKGFHLEMSAEHFGGFPASPETPYIIKRTVKQLAGDLQTVDLGIYAVNKFIRLPNSRHESSELYKVLLRSDELKLEVEEIMPLAMQPREELVPKWNRVVLPKDGLVLLKENAISNRQTSTSEQEIISALPEGEGDRFKMAVALTKRKHSFEAGDRNNFLFQLAAWCNDLGVCLPGDGEAAWDMIVNYLVQQEGISPSKWDRSESEGFKRTVTGVYSRKQDQHGKKEAFVAMEKSVQGDAFKAEINLIEACRTLAKNSTLSFRQKLFFLKSVNASSATELPEEKVAEIVLKHGKVEMERDVNNIGYTPEEVLPMYVDAIVESMEGGGQQIGIGPIDEAEENYYRGKYCLIIGKGGIGKSALLMQVARSFCSRNHRALHSTMEDSLVGLFKRVTMALYPPIALYDAAGNVVDYEDQYPKLKARIKDPLQRATVVAEMKRILKEKFGNNWVLDEIARMGASDYDKLIELLIRKYGNVDALFVDGHSMMKTHGSELESDIKNSADLKELAKKWKIGVFDLVHVPSSVHREKRSLEDNTRNGAKLMDNADFFISLSSISDPRRSSPGDTIYYKEFVYCRYHGKRTSGKIIDMILRIDPISLEVSVETLDTEHWMREYSEVF